MELRRIEKPFKNLDPLQYIEKRLRESKNSFRRDLLCEFTVAKHYLHNGYTFIAHRLKTPYGEVDLVFWSQDRGYVLVEVKSWSPQMEISDLITNRQKQRLKRVCLHFMESHQFISLDFVAVSQRLEIFEDFFSL